MLEHALPGMHRACLDAAMAARDLRRPRPGEPRGATGATRRASWVRPELRPWRTSAVASARRGARHVRAGAHAEAAALRERAAERREAVEVVNRAVLVD